ncbi:MAG: LTA synthase family protein [Bacteroides sp.]|nr:LTA synthase family protein [Bacteroides sp.]
MSALAFICLYFAFAVAYFALVQRPLFILCNRRSNPAGALSATDLRRIASAALRTDIVGAAYFTALPALVVIIASFTPSGQCQLPLRIVNIISALLVGLAAASDATVYSFWKSKIDASILHYLKQLGGISKSVSPLLLIGAIAAWLLLSAIFFAGAEVITRITVGRYPFAAHGVWPIVATIGGAILTLGALFACIRGTGHRPKTPAASFFSTNMFLNHCAVNTEYLFFYSFKSAGNLQKRFRFLPKEECDAKAADMYPVSGKPDCELLNTHRPNVLLIIWESLSARFVGQLGGREGVLTEFERLIGEGVFFTHVDAGNIRTDRGLVCVISGLPSPPAECIIKYTRKLPNLPSLPRTFGREGYKTSVWHGGDLTFYHKNDYYYAAGFDRVIDENGFPPEADRCKWGVHDGIVFDRVAADIEQATQRGERWFATLQTLSSHEPFIVPYDRLPDDKIANAFAYTDHCFGSFIERMKQTDAWRDMLVVVTGDHGFYGGEGIESHRYPHIPVLLLGGAVKQPAVIDTIMSQTDIAATLLGQLGIDHSDFPMSRDILSPTYRDRFSLHTHQTGFMVRDERGFTEFDLTSSSPVSNPDPDRELRGKVSLQHLFDYLSTR